MLPISPPTWQAPSRPVSAAREVTTLTRRSFHGEDGGRFSGRAAARLGRPARVRLSRRRHQRDHGRVRARRRRAPALHPGAPRGTGRPHGGGACKIYRRAGSVPGHPGGEGDPDAKHMIGETIKTAVAGGVKKDDERGEERAALPSSCPAGGEGGGGRDTILLQRP